MSIESVLAFIAAWPGNAPLAVKTSDGVVSVSRDDLLELTHTAQQGIALGQGVAERLAAADEAVAGAHGILDAVEAWAEELAADPASEWNGGDVAGKLRELLDSPEFDPRLVSEVAAALDGMEVSASPLTAEDRARLAQAAVRSTFVWLRENSTDDEQAEAPVFVNGREELQHEAAASARLTMTALAEGVVGQGIAQDSPAAGLTVEPS